MERSQLRTLARSQKMTLSFEETSTEQHSYAGQHTQSPLLCHALCIAGIRRDGHLLFEVEMYLQKGCIRYQGLVQVR